MHFGKPLADNLRMMCTSFNVTDNSEILVILERVLCQVTINKGADARSDPIETWIFASSDILVLVE